MFGDDACRRESALPVRHPMLRATRAIVPSCSTRPSPTDRRIRAAGGSGDGTRCTCQPPGDALAGFVAPAKAGARISCAHARPRPLDPGFRRDDAHRARLGPTNRRFVSSLTRCRQSPGHSSRPHGPRCAQARSTRWSTGLRRVARRGRLLPERNMFCSSTNDHIDSAENRVTMPLIGYPNKRNPRGTDRARQD